MLFLKLVILIFLCFVKKSIPAVPNQNSRIRSQSQRMQTLKSSHLNFLTTILAFSLWTAAAIAEDPCDSVRNTGLKCTTESVNLWRRDVGPIVVLRSTPLALPSGRLAVACCATTEVQEGTLALVTTLPKNS